MSSIRDAEAQAVIQRILSIQETYLPAQDPALGITLNNLAEIYRSRGRFVAADSLYRRSLMILEAALGKRHAWGARVLNEFGASKIGTEH